MIEIEAQVFSHQIWGRTYDLSLLLNTECSSFMYIKGFINNACRRTHTRMQISLILYELFEIILHNLSPIKLICHFK